VTAARARVRQHQVALHDEEEARKRSVLKSTIAALQGELMAIKAQMDRTYELFDIAGTASAFVAQILIAPAGNAPSIQKAIDALASEPEAEPVLDTFDDNWTEIALIAGTLSPVSAMKHSGSCTRTATMRYHSQHREPGCPP
jgi:hypothetical protein